MRKSAAIALGVVPLLALTACAGGTDSADGASTELNIYAWAGEIPDSVVAAFEDETGISVTVDTFDSNETMISKLAAGNSGYDIVEPSQYAVQLLVGQELIAPIDYDQIEGAENIQTKFVDPAYDPGNEHAVPWIWGSTGLLYNIDCTGEELTSWKSMFDEKYAGKIYMLDNMLASYIVGLQVNGFGADSTDPDEIETATQTLIDQKPLLAGYNSTNYYDLVSAGDACMSLAWGGSSVAGALADNPSLRYILPEEGGTLWTDSFSVVADAPHSDAAYEWLNFTLRPEIAAMATNDGSLATTNEAALEFVTDESLLDNPAIFAPADQLDAADFIVDPGEAMSYFQDGWTRVKAS
ncbi:PotD/PotF family extracellular solute-binding protein [Microbacterium fluvii]|uniref:PotD/PotF family extracellular solute-binding protein n=1 Tax=Microbacterium fluvii TaxID=415215 RepID=A0ABW2HGN9_9MICO|nr:spermidine/putrescine ABC transporter substrate-binding protein [Microbacterium fluvii]MCU4673954.1 spermidine/putrescine ABC transporter substrate-binding protein [Microbacterium fluvii]